MTFMTERDTLIEIIKTRSFQYSETPSFKLSTGGVSNFYFNMKKTTQSPEGMYITGSLIYEKIKELGLRIKAVGGLTLGADPIAYATSFYSYLKDDYIEAFVVRKEPKGYGMMLQIEGNVNPGDNVIILDDVITTGGATIKAINIARQNNLIVDAAIILVDRCEQNGRQNIEALGLPVYSIFMVNDFLPH